MELHSIGLNIRHIGNFCIDRLLGSEDYLLLVFKTNALIKLDDLEVVAAPNSCMLYKKNTKQLYGTCGKTYVNHYIHFNCEAETQITDIGLPFHTPFFLANPTEIEDIFTILCREQISTHLHKAENIDLLLRLVLQKISDNATNRVVTPEDARQREDFTALRAEMYSNAGKYTSIQEMAHKMNLSMSHFQTVYHQQFGISCYDDLLTAKVMSAQHHLSNTNLSIKEIALLCGYENATCFMRCFKHRTGLTPTQYRLKR